MHQEQEHTILLVEDDMIIAADLSLQLTKLGYKVIGISTHAEDALKIIVDNRPDVILMDIVLGGAMNGIEAASLVLKQYQIPVIFLTSNTDNATFQKALTAKPYAFIAKPFQNSELARTLQLTIERINVEESQIATEDADHISAMEDRLFIRHKGEMVKVAIQDVLFLKADRNYCTLQTSSRALLVSVPLATVASQLPTKQFVRTHRSYLVNIFLIDSISEGHEYLTCGNYQVPISRRMKEDVVSRLRMV